jgi:CubicO group peptidase (beta-lactamase class C family)
VLARAALVTAFLVIGPAAGAWAASPTSSAAEVEDRVRRSFERSGVPGMVAVVVHDDDVVWSGGFGKASDGAPMTADSRVQVASVTKSFTATAVLGLVEDGRVDLDGTVASQLAGFAMADPRAARVTVRQLLNHTSGLTDAGTGFYAAVDEGSATPGAFVAALLDEHLTSDPGTEHRYANINYVLAGRLVEVVTGLPFEEHLREEVLDPLGLESTTLDRDAAPNGHVSAFSAWIPREDTSSELTHDPAGALVTTADDLGRWLIASNGDGPAPLSSAVRAQLEVTTPASGGYGAGWAQDEELAGWWGHAGNRYTYSAHTMRNPDSGRAVAVVVNGASMSDPAYAAARDLAALVDDGGPSPAVPVPDAVSADRGALAVVAVAAALGGIGVARSRRWARRRAGHPARTVLGLSWLLPPIALALLLPPVAGRVVGGIDMTWSMLTYYSLTPLLTVLALALTCTAVLAARVVALHRAGRL